MRMGTFFQILPALCFRVYCNIMETLQLESIVPPEQSLQLKPYLAETEDEVASRNISLMHELPDRTAKQQVTFWRGGISGKFSKDRPNCSTKNK